MTPFGTVLKHALHERDSLQQQLAADLDIQRKILPTHWGWIYANDGNYIVRQVIHSMKGYPTSLLGYRHG